MSDHTAKDLLSKIRGDSTSRKSAIMSLANDEVLRNSVKKHIQRNSGSSTDADTIFNDMIVVFIKIVHNKEILKIETNLHAFLMGIAKNLWYNELKKKHRRNTVDLDKIKPPVDKNIPQVELLIKEDRARLLTAILDQMKVRCKEVLMYWSAGYKMKEIALKLGYKSEGMARKKKSECMKELLTYLADKPHLKSQLSNI